MPSLFGASLSVSLGTACAICGGETEAILALPSLPLTDTFTREPMANPISGIDQTFRFCGDCRHGQLEYQISPEILYGSNYCFRTSVSPTARKGTEFFFSVLDQVAAGRRFKAAIDLGCNDLFLLDRLGERAAARIGIDPLWRGREEEREESDIRVIGAAIEDVDFSALPEKPDLVICRHTLEHIAHPMDVIGHLMEGAAKDALFVFEVPGLEALVNRHRFDQIFHQHLQYFTMASFLRMLKLLGAQPLVVKSNYHDWGAFAVAFVRGRGGMVDAPERVPNSRRVMRSIAVFQDEMRAVRGLLAGLEGRIFGYGAAQMLPVLAYHLGTDLAFLEAVLDDDPEKDGVHYWNLPVKILPSAAVGDLVDASVLITAVDSVQPIMRRLLENRPKHIIYPFNTI